MSLAKSAWSPQKAWGGRVDHPSDPKQKRIHQEIEEATSFTQEAPDNCSAVIAGFATDEGVGRNQGRKGAAQGPEILRKALGGLPSHGYSFFDAGNVSVEGDDLEGAQSQIEDLLRPHYTAQKQCLLLGGGHEISYPHFLAIQEATPKQRIGIINIDAHFDLRPTVDSGSHSGSPFLEIAQRQRSQGRHFNYLALGIQPEANTTSLFETAHDFGVDYVLCDDILNREKATKRAITHICKDTDVIYLTVCLDAFSLAVAPGVSAPNPNGLFPDFFPFALETILDKSELVGADIAELNPKYDHDGHTARLAARFGWQILGAFCQQR